MKKRVSCTALLCVAFLSGATEGRDPRFTKQDELTLPEDYREWIYVTSGLGMSYGVRPTASEHPVFDNVFVKPESYRAFLKTGHWPEKTMFVLEIRSSESHGSINKSGHYQGDIVAVDAAVKDGKRYQEKWAYFTFQAQGTKITRLTKAQSGDSACNTCHRKNAAVENTFVQFYPTLLDVARAKLTLNPGYHP